MTTASTITIPVATLTNMPPLSKFSMDWKNQCMEWSGFDDFFGSPVESRGEGQVKEAGETEKKEAVAKKTKVKKKLKGKKSTKTKVEAKVDTKAAQVAVGDNVNKEIQGKMKVKTKKKMKTKEKTATVLESKGEGSQTKGGRDNHSPVTGPLTDVNSPARVQLRLEMQAELRRVREAEMAEEQTQEKKKVLIQKKRVRKKAPAVADDSQAPEQKKAKIDSEQAEINRLEGVINDQPEQEITSDQVVESQEDSPLQPLEKDFLLPASAPCSPEEALRLREELGIKVSSELCPAPVSANDDPRLPGLFATFMWKKNLKSPSAIQRLGEDPTNYFFKFL
jgi:hypothetical protein